MLRQNMYIAVENKLHRILKYKRHLLKPQRKQDQMPEGTRAYVYSYASVCCRYACGFIVELLG
nr:MAG: MC009.1R [Molluscum contagiosum virus]